MNLSALPEVDSLCGMLESLAENGTPRPGIAQVIDVGTGDFLNFVDKELLEDFIPKGGSTCRFFEGTYGSGKTHLLQLIEDLALNRGFVVCRVDLANDLSFENWSQITKYILENCRINIEGRIIRKLPNILFELQYSEFLTKSKLDKAQLSHPGFQNAILHAVNASHLDYAAKKNIYRFLLGEKVTAKEMNASGLRTVKNPLGTSNAEQILNTVFNGFHLLGMKGFVLLFDETDESWIRYSGSVPPRRIRVASNLIRRFIDSCALGRVMGLLAVFAVLPSFIGDCKQCYPALGERLGFERTEDKEAAWRWPVLPISAVNSLYSTCENDAIAREKFLRKTIENFVSIVDYCKGDSSGIEEELLKIGIEQLEAHAGKDYKRAVIKAFAFCSLERIGF